MDNNADFLRWALVVSCVGIGRCTRYAGDQSPNCAAQFPAGLYVVGCLLSTILFNFPSNDQLESVDSHGDGELALWDIYLVRWTCWNHVRSVATVLSTALLAYALSEI